MVNKKGAMELSIGTIVIIVLAMSMLILGLVLVRTIFTGAKFNVDTMNDKVTDEINKLFVEDKKIVVYLSNGIAKINQGNEWGVAFGIKNLYSGSEASKFEYELEIANPDEVRDNCGKNVDPLDWITAGKSSSTTLLPGESKAWRIRFEIPETAPLCTVRYDIIVESNSDDAPSDGYYTSESFDVQIKG